MRKKMLKAIKELNDYIDNDREKLCDRIHNLELSHKRQERLLKRFLEIGKYFKIYLIGPVWDKLYDDVKAELSYPYFRLKSKKLPDLHEFYGK